jgi:FkbM family methyltransferase
MRECGSMATSGIPQSPMSSGGLAEAFEHLRSHPEQRALVIKGLLSVEDELLKASGLNVREKLTGPMVDAMHAHGETVVKSIASGLSFECGYTSKIIRDFVMAPNAMPDHVYEPQNTRLMVTLARGARHVLIGGAFIGDHTLPAAQAMGGGGVVHAFEVSPVNIGLLRRNMARNSIGNVRVNEIALWSDENERIGLKGEDSHASPYRIPIGDAGDSLPATTINLYGRQNAIAKLDVVLLDIEGGEIEALKGASNYLGMGPDAAPTVIFEVHASYVDWSNGLANADIVRMMTGHGYTVYALRDYNSNVDMTGFPIEFVDLSDIYLKGPPHGFNMVAVKDPGLISRLGVKVRKGVSPKLLKHGDPAFHAPIAG